MNRLARTQVSILAAYSSPFVLLSALLLNSILFSQGVTTGSLRLVVLSTAFPVGFGFGRVIYQRRSHVEILLDGKIFRVRKGSREIAEGSWGNYRLVSIVVDQFGRANLRLYKSADGDYVDLPISRVGADPQELRDHIAGLISKRESTASILQAVEAS